MNCVLTKHNFQSKLEGIKMSLSKANFIAIDAKFSQYPPITQRKQSSFVTAEEQYLSISQNIDTCFIMQFDITAFISNKSPTENKYSACTYIFYLFRRYVPNSKSCLGIQNSVFSSLRDSNFPFDTFFKDGITYLNKNEEKQLHDDLGVYMRLSSRKKAKGFYLTLTDDMQGIVDLVSVEIKIWMNSDSTDPLVLNELDYTNKLLIHLVLNEINLKFFGLWACYDESDKILVKKVNDYQRAKEETAVGKTSTFNEYFVMCCVGFSELFKFLTTCNKPIIGHDILTNLMIMYNLFHTPLPNTYDEFKVNLHILFPSVYDTRFLSFELLKKVKLCDLWESNRLDDLYQYLKKNYPSNDTSYSPIIKLLDKFDANVSDTDMFIESKGHNKSFQVGYCFIKMMHILATHELSISGNDAKYLTNNEHLSAVKKFENCLYLSHANISHMWLNGPDPQPDDNHWILVKPAKMKSEIDNLKLEQDCNHVCAFVIERRISKKEVLIGTDTPAGVRSLIKHMRSLHCYKAVPYKFSDPDSTTMSSTARIWPGILGLLISGVAGWIILKMLRIKTRRK